MEKKRLENIKKEIDKDESRFHRGLAKIYQNRDGSLPDISQLEVRRKKHWPIYLTASLLILGALSAISWLGFIIFNPNSQFNDKSIKLDLQGQQSIASGDEVTYALQYKNIEKVNLKNLEIIFRYPAGFEFSSAEPKPTNSFNTAWQIGDLPKNGSGKIEIKGRIIGAVGSLKTIDATASFQPENFSSQFKETASFSSQITSSIIEIELDGPEQALLEKQITYKIKYRNSSDQDLSNIKIIANYPANFVFKSSDPKPSTEDSDARNLNNQWLIDKLEKRQEGEIEINGGYIKTADDNSGMASLGVQIGFFDPATDNLELQQEKSISTKIIGKDLSLNLILNGSNQDQPINFGQTLTYSIVYKNLGQQDIDDLQISISLDSDVLDWATLEDKNAGKIEGKQITWNKDQISEFDLIRPLDERTLDLTIQVKPANQINISKTNLQLQSYVTAAMQKIGDLDASDIKIESNKIISNINTDIELKVEGRYFDDDNIAVGTGPLPPVVGQTTSFRVYWSLANSLHEVSDVKVTTVLPAGVDWVNKFLVKTGSLSYSSKERKVTWSISKIPANKTFDDVNVWFDVSVTPTKEQVRKLIILTDQTNLTAFDRVTGSAISKDGKAITSNLEDDPVATGKGLVIDITE